jgi:hypothetical protein
MLFAEFAGNARIGARSSLLRLRCGLTASNGPSWWKTVALRLIECLTGAIAAHISGVSSFLQTRPSFSNGGGRRDDVGLKGKEESGQTYTLRHICQSDPIGRSNPCHEASCDEVWKNLLWSHRLHASC